MHDPQDRGAASYPFRSASELLSFRITHQQGRTHPGIRHTEVALAVVASSMTMVTASAITPAALKILRLLTVLPPASGDNNLK